MTSKRAASGESCMSLRIVEFGSSVSSDIRDEPSLINISGYLDLSFHYWRGASGKRYLHTIYPLLKCPVLPQANYILVGHNAEGRKIPLRISRTEEQASSLNLAHIRQKAAASGADEIHIHLLADTIRERSIVEMDLQVGLFGTLSSHAVL